MRVALLAATILLLAVAPASAAPALVKIGDFTAPVHVASPPQDPRVFVVEQDGLVKIAGGGIFLELTDETLNGEERGLLSVAFPPDYGTSGRFYLFLTSRPSGDVEVREYRRSAANPNLAEPAPVRTLLDEPHSASNHNGGQLQFGPDGALFVSIGDNADGQNAQILSSPFGKILRIDIATGARSVWSHGLRNPWRFSFDPPTGDLIIGDVGENTWEEINWSPAPTSGNGVNWGWPASEGGPSATIAMDHSGSDAFCAIVGGYVVRDPGLPTLNGRYLYGDNCHTSLYSAVARTGADNRPEALTVSGLSSFGTNGCGHVFVASRGSNAVYRIQDGAPTPCNYPNPAPVPVTTQADTVAPSLRVRILRPSLKRLRLAVTCSEACRIAVAGKLRRVRKLGTRHRSLAAGKRTVVRIQLTRKTTRKLRRALNRRGYVRLALTVRATDVAGNQHVVTRRGRLTRRR
jgi:Glucose / Sorbosone dehydrogenase